MRRAAVVLILLVAATGCGGDAVEPGTPDGELDCDDTRGTVMIDRPDSGGELTPFEAMEAWADRAYPDLEHSIHVVTARTGTVVVDASEVALITVEELADETFAMQRVNGCPGFEGES